MKLKEYRLQKGMKQEDVAKHLGLPTKTYQNYEREVREADTEVLCALADLYKISLDELVGRTTVEPNTVVETLQMQDELLGIFKTINEDGKHFLLKLARCVEEHFNKED